MSVAAPTNDPNPEAGGEVLIKDIAKGAHQLLACCNDIMEKDIKLIAQMQFDRFNVWASNIGVFARGQASLDHRLRAAPAAKAAVEAELEILCERLLTVLNGGHDMSEEELDDFIKLKPPKLGEFVAELARKGAAIPNSRAKEVLKEVELTISGLHQISMTIRRASNRNSLAKASELFDEDEGYNIFKNLKGDLEYDIFKAEPAVRFQTTTTFRQFISEVVRKRWAKPNSKENKEISNELREYRDVILTRCEDAIVMRRRQLMYLKGHQVRLQKIDVTSSDPKLQSTTPSTKRPVHWLPPRHIIKPTLPPISGTNSQDDTAASELPSNFTVVLPKRLKAYPSTATSSEGGELRDTGRFEVPPTPKVEKWEQEKACPYCCLVLPISTYDEHKNYKLWRRHLVEDMQPHICLFRNCNVGKKVYSTTEEWQTHLGSPHLEGWICPLEDKHGEIMYSTEVECKFHMDSEHPDLDDEEVRDALRAAGKPASLPRKCFVCLHELPGKTEIEIASHVASHLQAVFVLALPWREDIDLETVMSSRGAHSSTNEESRDDNEIEDLLQIQELPEYLDNRNRDQLASGSIGLGERLTKEVLAEKDTKEVPRDPMDNWMGDLASIASSQATDSESGGNINSNNENKETLQPKGNLQLYKARTGFIKAELRQLYPDLGLSEADAMAKVDIIAVHGLNPRNKEIDKHAWDTWRTPPGEKGRLWLRDDLPKLLPKSRIFLYEYDATVVYGQSRATFVDNANALLEAVRIKRTKVESRAIIFIGHSMGGLLIKQALINAHQNIKHIPIKNAVSGLAFFATPHKGGDGMLISLGGLAVKMAQALGFQKGDNVVKVLEEGSMFSDIMSEHWRHQLLEYDIVSFWGSLDDVISRESARLGLPGDRENIVKLDADHRRICNFGESQTDQDNLELVLVNLADLYQRAPRQHDDWHSPVHYIPLGRNNRFTGRDSVLNKLKEKLFFRRECQKLAIFGLGGVGKTQLALQFAYWVKDNRPEYSVFWVPALSDETFEKAYMELAMRLSISASKDEDLKELVQRHLSLESNGKWLLILDNADNYELLFGSADKPGGFNRYLPQSDNGLLLFTTRSKEVAISAVGSDVIDLQEMNPEEATRLLEKIIIRKNILQNGVIVGELLQELTHLPLAIAQAAAYLNRNRMSVEKYLSLLRGTEVSMVELMSREFRDDTRYPGSQNAVATTWLVSFDEIRRSDAAAAELLSFISFVEPKAIPQSLLPNQGSDVKMGHAIGTLFGYAFLTEREEQYMFDMHRLVHLATQVWLQKHQLASQTVVEVIKHLKYIFPPDNAENRELWRQYLPHALRVLDKSVDCRTDERYELFYSVGRCLYRDRRYKEAVRAMREVFIWRGENRYRDPNDQLNLENWMAITYLGDRQIERAIPILEHVLASRQNTLEETHPDRLTSQHNLANAYYNDNRVKEAILILQNIVAIRKDVLAEEDDNRLLSEHELGQAYLADQQIQRAIEVLGHVVAIYQRTLAKDNNDRLLSEQNLAHAYLADNRVKEAISIFEHVVAIREKTLVEEDHNRLSSEHELARAYLDADRVKEAVPILEHIVAIRRNTMVEEDQSRLASEHSLASAYLSDHRMEDAISILKNIVAVQARTLHADDPRRLISQESLANAHKKVEAALKSLVKK